MANPLQSAAAGAAADAARPVLELSDVRKRFGGVVALNGVSFSLRAGEVHALVGENGAGKSTLIKILCGIVKRDDGQIALDGTAYEPHSPADAKAHGIQVVHQEFNLLPYLSVAENICFEDIPRKRFGVVDYKAVYDKARQALARIGLDDIDVRRPVETLGVAHRQLVEIARALMGESRILILDEPTATLTARETERLFAIIDGLRAKGVAIVFVSHHLNEVFANCDRVTVLRNGESVMTADIADMTREKLVASMVGRQLAAQMAETRNLDASSRIALSLKNLRHPASPHADGVSLDMRYGEILGIAGLVGAGRTELLRAIFAADLPLSGTLERDGQPRRYTSPKAAIRDGIGFLTEDRKEEGLILAMSIAANVSLANLGKVSRAGLLDAEAETRLTEKLGKEIKLKYGKTADAASTLSGGNQQKVVLAKWLANDPKILLLDEPTRGVDVGAKAEIYALLRGLADKGLALLVVSSELPELITLCDRILVMSKHRIAGEVAREDFSEERILSLAYKDENNHGRH
ncbi:MAG: sugar ABC transporter ATP-binding protein [Aquamicrobium sp.]|uniref:sugar ABC transporter ATP-binding protein n=1 Tax=Mesorhizobium sp. Pch-S TaxID=2082387 RepID=UPI0010104A96|nr:sugar ABC transporter ATP-binding protein [Mesorhizobium sp. Pch-S]MBR2688966.1 sugar ABC transporter ATP-binding protein [Aquamicrobium sp.]QAZ44405.1 D-xylose ABC transporter ATP-binding protein [Mesorhizobium sp. Pch-S]